MVSQPKESNTDPISIEGLEDLLETRTDTPDPDRTRPDMSPTPDNWWTLSKAAAELQINERTLRRWIKRGKLIAQKVQGAWGEEWRIKPGADTPDPDRTRPDMSPTPDNRSHDSKRLVGVEVIALQTQLDVALSEIKHLKQELQGATFRNGYLEAQMEQSREQIKLLTDRQSKSRWAKFWAWFTGKAE